MSMIKNIKTLDVKVGKMRCGIGAPVVPSGFVSGVVQVEMFGYQDPEKGMVQDTEFLIEFLHNRESGVLEYDVADLRDYLEAAQEAEYCYIDALNEQYLNKEDELEMIDLEIFEAVEEAYNVHVFRG